MEGRRSGIEGQLQARVDVEPTYRGEDFAIDVDRISSLSSNSIASGHTRVPISLSMLLFTARLSESWLGIRVSTQTQDCEAEVSYGRRAPC